MQVIDNLTRLRGQLVRRAAHPTRTGYETLTLQVDETQPVDGKADLLGRHCGRLLEVAVPAALLKGVPVGPGVQVTLRAKMTPDGPMAEPHPEAGQFSVVPGPDVD